MKTSVPEWIKSYVEEERQLELEGDTYTYLVVKSSLCMTLDIPPVFISKIGEVFAVSDAYPEAWRKLAIMHDIMERDARPSAFSHLSATRRELDLARSIGVEMSSYVTFRIEFFSNLVAHFEDSSIRTKTEPEIERIRRSVRYLVFIHAKLGNQ